MKAQISGLGQAMANTQEADNMVKTAEGAMAQINSLLNNIRDLTVNAQNTGVNDANAIAADQAQSDQMVASIDNIASTTQFDGKNLLDGTATGLQLQLGANDGQTTSLDLPDMTSTTLGVDKLDVCRERHARRPLTRRSRPSRRPARPWAPSRPAPSSPT